MVWQAGRLHRKCPRPPAIDAISCPAAPRSVAPPGRRSPEPSRGERTGKGGRGHYYGDGDTGESGSDPAGAKIASMCSCRLTRLVGECAIIVAAQMKGYRIGQADQRSIWTETRLIQRLPT